MVITFTPVGMETGGSTYYPAVIHAVVWINLKNEVFMHYL